MAYICQSADMRTTLNLDDTLYRRAKIRAAETGRTVSDLVAEGLNLLLAGNPRAVKSPGACRSPHHRRPSRAPRQRHDPGENRRAPAGP